MSVYTKRGDRGKTHLYSTDPTLEIRVSKSSKLIGAIGSIDELNSALGICTYYSKKKKVLLDIQNDLFDIGAILAGTKQNFSKEKIKYLEKEIDAMEKILPVLRNFILPGGSLLSSQLHMSRSITRRAERELWKADKRKKINPNILIYLNRLSDYLFISARWVNFKDKVKDVPWKRVT